MNCYPLFTRFLYIKTDVVWSLATALLNQNKNESLFWAYELYYSGFDSELCKYIIFIYHDIYESVLPKPVCRFIDSIIENKMEVDAAVAIIITTLIQYKPTYPSADENTIKELKAANKKKKYFFVQYESKDICAYQTDVMTKEKKHYHILNSVCIYNSTKCNDPSMRTLVCDHFACDPILTRREIGEIFRSNAWLYYASFTPIWKERIDEYNGYVNESSHRVLFETEEIESEFYLKYGYEPDEQPQQVFDYCIGIE